MLLRTRAGATLGELRNATARSFRFPHLRTPTVGFTIDATHPLASVLLDVDKVLVAVYEDSTGSKVLRFQGPVVGYQKTRNAQGGSLAVTVAGVGWRLDHRLIGRSGLIPVNDSGATFGTTPLSLLDRGEIMGRIIDALNVGEFVNVWANANDTGIRRGVITASSQTYISDWRYKPAGEAFADLSGTLDGPEWVIRPVEPTTDAIGVQLGALDVAPIIGTVQSNVAFEFGTGHYSVGDWTDIADASGLCNEAVSLPSGYPNNATESVLEWLDSPSILNDRGLHEAVIAGDIVTADLRLKLIQNAVQLRKIPKRTIAFTPIAEDAGAPIDQRRVPRLFADYNVGDTVRFRAIERFPIYDTLGTVIDTIAIPTVDLLMRVFAAQIDLDPNGVASTQVTLVNDGS